MAHDVFISYSSKDKPIADAVCTNMETAGIRCWFAPRDIAPGEDWPTAITTAISKSRVMVLIFSSNSNSSEDVSRELMLAANSRLVIIPFKIDNIEPEPGKQYYLARTHWLDAVNPPTQEQINILVRRVTSILPATAEVPPIKVEPVPAPPTPPPTKALPGKKRARLWPLWAVLALAVLGFIAWSVLGGGLNRLFTPSIPTRTFMDLSVLTPSKPTETTLDFSSIVGTFSGMVVNDNTQQEMQITITIQPGCAVGRVCAHFDNPTLPCSGDFAFLQMTAGLYEFEARNKTGTCGAARDFLQPQAGGTLLYISQSSEFGETRGVLIMTAQVLFSTGFDNPSFDGSIDSDFWLAPTNNFYFLIKQANGAMTFLTQNLHGDQTGKLTSRLQWSLSNISYAEAKLTIDKPVYGSNANNAVTLADAGGMWAGCGIQTGNPEPFIWCGQAGEYTDSYMSDSYPAEYGKSYTIRIAFNHQTNTFEGYINGSLFYSWQPASIEQILNQDMMVSIGLWTDRNTNVTGYVDDVRVGK